MAHSLVQLRTLTVPSMAEGRPQDADNEVDGLKAAEDLQLLDTQF